MIKIYKRYIAREVFLTVLLVLFAFLILFTFFEFIEELRRIGKANYSLLHALIFEILRIPGLCYELLPIATLIGTLYALSNLARHSEITVLRASGLATRRLLFLLFQWAFFLAVFTFVLGEFLVPFCEKKAQSIRNNALERVIAQAGFASGLWVKDGKSFINVQRALPQAKLENIRIYHFDEQNNLLFVKEAKWAEYHSDQKEWVLNQVQTTEIQNKNQALVKKEKESIEL